MNLHTHLLPLVTVSTLPVWILCIHTASVDTVYTHLHIYIVDTLVVWILCIHIDVYIVDTLVVCRHFYIRHSSEASD